MLQGDFHARFGWLCHWISFFTRCAIALSFFNWNPIKSRRSALQKPAGRRNKTEINWKFLAIFLSSLWLFTVHPWESRNWFLTFCCEKRAEEKWDLVFGTEESRYANVVRARRSFLKFKGGWCSGELVIATRNPSFWEERLKSRLAVWAREEIWSRSTMLID